jgi:hypothetical protein
MANHPIIDTGAGFVGDAPTLTLDADGKLTEQQLINLSTWMRAVTRALSGGLRVAPADTRAVAGMLLIDGARAGNLDGQIRRWYFPVANTADAVPHGLGRVPIAAILLRSDQLGTVLNARLHEMWNDEVIYVNSSTATTTVWMLIL